jgi:hypothetical protein
MERNLVELIPWAPPRVHGPVAAVGTVKSGLPARMDLIAAGFDSPSCLGTRLR